MATVTVTTAVVAAELASLRAAAETIARRATEETGYDTLARFYLDDLTWFFARPRFLLSHALLTRRDRHWLSVKRREDLSAKLRASRDARESDSKTQKRVFAANTLSFLIHNGVQMNAGSV